MNSIDKLGWVHEVPGTVYTHANIHKPMASCVCAFIRRLSLPMGMPEGAVCHVLGNSSSTRLTVQPEGSDPQNTGGQVGQSV